MKESKGVYVTKHNIREDQLNRNYHLYTSKITRDYRYGISTRDAGVQYNYRRDNVICTCRNITGLRRHQEVRYFSGFPKQIYAYHGSKSFTDIGVGSVKTYQRRKVKRIYLPETDDRGVGSTDLSSFISRRTRYYRDSFYDHKRTSSKCVGRVIEGDADVLNEQLSPIVQTKSATTSPSIPLVEEQKKNVEIGSNTHEKSFVTTSTQIQDGDIKKEDDRKEVKVVEVVVEQRLVKDQSAKQKKSKEEIATSTEPNAKRISKRAQEAERVFSSDSLVQHVHNLEHPSEDKQESPMVIDPMENKLEREYRKMFSTKSKDSKEQKPSNDEKPEAAMKSTSVLRRRFEALRRGLSKREDSKKNAVLIKDSSNVSALSHRDVSIASDPPSLEARSYSNTKIYSPFPSTDQEKDASTSRTVYNKSYIGKKEWSRPEEDDSECQGVKGMFKLWGKKFNLEDEESSPIPSVDISKKPKERIPTTESESKKEGKKFFFFKKKSKDKTKQPYKQKKGVTAGRCEVGDGLMIKIGAANSPPPEKERKEINQIPADYEDMLRKAWLQQFLAQTIESRPSVKIRWNNNAYATSSSTVFEIMENVYKDTGVIFRSRSEVTTGESSYYKSFTKQHVNFVQDIEAWMMPKFIPDKPMPVICNAEKGDKKDNIEVRISDQKWFIDKSKAFAQKIEVVLHSENLVHKRKDPSSEYLRIDIPKGFFTDSGSDSTGQMQTSNEEVYKIVEYETPESNNYLRKNRNVETGDYLAKDIKVTVSVKDGEDLESKILETVIKRPPIHRDVVIQGSNVYIPKRCNVIGVGIITQKDITKLRKPILKIQDDYSDDESDHTIHQTHNKSKFAESYLQDYYRHWTPLGIDFFSWCVSDSHLQCCSENSHSTVNNQGDGSKSCPNIYDDYHASTVISSCGTSCCSHCAPWEEEPVIQGHKEGKEPLMTKLFGKFKSKAKSEPAEESGTKRVLPKDSLEVFKKRKLYAASNKSNWACADDRPYSIPSIESRGAQDTLGDSSKVKKTCYKPSEAKPKKKVCRKHVSLPDCDTMNELLASQLADKSPLPGILTFKGSSKCEECNNKGVVCPKHPTIVPEPTCTIPPPTQPCKEPPMTLPDSPSPPRSPIRTSPKLPCPPKSPPKSPPQPSSVKSPCPSPPKPPCPPPPKSPCPPPPKPPCASPPKSPCPKRPGTPPCGSAQSSGIHLHSPPTPPTPPKPKPPPKPKKCSTPPCKPSPPPLPPCKQKSPQCTPRMSKRKPPPCSPPKRRSPPPCSPSPPCPTPKKKPPQRSQAPPSCPPSCPSTPPPCPTPKQKSSQHSQSQTSCPPSCPSTPPPKKKTSKRSRSPPSPAPCPPPKRRSCPSSPPECPSAPPPCPPPKKKPCPSSLPPSPPVCPGPPLTCQPPTPYCPEAPSPPPSPPSKKKSVAPCQQTPAPCKNKNIPGPKSKCNKASPSPSCKNAPKKKGKKSSSPPSSASSKPSSSETESDSEPEPRRAPCSPRPPCDACKKCPSQEFPWPMKNQVSNQSLTSLCMPIPQEPECEIEEPPCPQAPVNIEPQVDIPKCKKGCSFVPPECPKPKPCEPKPCRSPPKVSGIFLKMKGSRKTCSKDCSAWDNSSQCPERNSSEENITINIKKETVSTEEIREGFNIKVQDEDGRTLYERREYKKQRPSLLNDMYKSNLHHHTVSTSIVQNMALDEKSDTEDQDMKSEPSVANLIEINFKLKVIQGDKTTEINIGNDGVAEKPRTDTKNAIGQTSHECFMLKDEAEQCGEEINDKNDINIKIVIKNYKPKKQNDTKKYSEETEEFTQKISEKFQTVSTGYSDIVTEQTVQNEQIEKTEQKPDNVFSVHRTTIDLTTSTEISKTKIASSKENESNEYIAREPIDLMVSSRSATGKSGIEHSESKIGDSPSMSGLMKNDKKNSYKNKPCYSMTDTDDQEVATDVNNLSDDPKDFNSAEMLAESLTKEEKKRLLKKIFEKASKSRKMKNKGKLKQLRDMLKVILTSDSSDHDEMAVKSNELVKEMTYASLKPNYFRDTDSMNNYYKIDSSVIFSAKSSNVKPNLIYPTKNISQSTVRDSDGAISDDNDESKQACLCSTLAARLNMCKGNEVSGACCCKRSHKADEETCCDLRTEEDFFLLNYKTIEYIDVETQNSKFICNSRNFSVHSRAISGSVRNCIDVKTIRNTEINDMNCTGFSAKKVKKTFSPRTSHIQPCEMKKLNRNTMLGISDEDKVYLMNARPTKVSVRHNVSRLSQDKSQGRYSKKKSGKYDRPADILQCYETKKAVLEIYAEKTLSDDGAHLVAKLPKFVIDKESEIERNYKCYAESNRDMKRNFVMMSVDR